MADGTGAATGLAGEGNFVKVADLTSITRNVYDQSAADVLVIGPTTLVLADVVLDTVVTSTALWEGDSVGYNFKDHVPKTAFPTGGHIYRIEYAFIPTAGSTYGWSEAVVGSAEAFLGS
jgi:hypothetical protein